MPDLGLRLCASLWLAPGAGAPHRALHCCTARGCPCAGVYFRQDARKDCHIVVRVFVDGAAPVSPHARHAAQMLLRSHRPRWRVEHGGQAVRDTKVSRHKWVANAALLGGGHWEIGLQPLHATPAGKPLATVRVFVGPNVVTTAAFVVRNVVSQWVSLSLLPCALGRTGVRELVAGATGSQNFTVVMCDSADAGKCALVRFESKQAATAAYLAWLRSPLRARQAPMSFVAPEPRVAAGRAPRTQPPQPPARLAVHVCMQAAEPTSKVSAAAACPSTEPATTTSPTKEQDDDLAWLDCVSPFALGVQPL